MYYFIVENMGKFFFYFFTYSNIFFSLKKIRTAKMELVHIVTSIKEFLATIKDQYIGPIPPNGENILRDELFRMFQNHTREYLKVLVENCSLSDTKNIDENANATAMRMIEAFAFFLSDRDEKKRQSVDKCFAIADLLVDYLFQMTSVRNWFNESVSSTEQLIDDELKKLDPITTELLQNIFRIIVPDSDEKKEDLVKNCLIELYDEARKQTDL